VHQIELKRRTEAVSLNPGASRFRQCAHASVVRMKPRQELASLLLPFRIAVDFQGAEGELSEQPELTADAISAGCKRIQITLPRRSECQGELAWDSPIAAASLVLSRVLGLVPPLLTADATTFRLLRAAFSSAIDAVPQLVEGETGTGKKLLARLIHAARGGSEFVNLDGAMLDLKASRPFRLREANEHPPLPVGSTVFIERADEIPPSEQTRLAELIRVQRWRQPDGKMGLHYIAASSVVQSETTIGIGLTPALRGVFEVVVKIPPLRARREDIPMLTNYFLALHDSHQSLGSDAIAALCEYSFPGNVRELRNVVTRLAINRGVTATPIRSSDIRQYLGPSLQVRT
jgi:hypothetical protein